MMFADFHKWNTRLLLICFTTFVVRYDTCASTHALPTVKSWAPPDLASKLDAVVESLQKCVRYPGLTVAVVKTEANSNEPFTFTRNYGVSSVESKRPVDGNTRFCIGSVTKGFTAALITQILHDNLNFTLDTPVRDILGLDFELCDKERSEETSIRDLLAHKVGVAKHFGAFLMGYNLSRPDIVRKARHLPSLHPFRSSRVFNNFMYVIAGQIAEKLNGTWWENQILWRFLKKLNMDRTTFADRVPDWTDNFAIPHALENGKLITLRAKVTGNILRPVGPAGSICTTATDMVKWMLMHLQNGTNESGQSVISPLVLEELFKLQNPFPNPIKSGERTLHIDSMAKGYGLGWVIGSYRGYTRIIHSGFSNYYYSMVSLLPEQGIGIFTALNGPHLIKCDNGMKALHFYLTDLLLGEKPWMDERTICSYPRGFLLHRNGSPEMQNSEDPMDITTESNFVVPSSTVTATNDDYDSNSTTEFVTSDSAILNSSPDKAHMLNVISDKATITEPSMLFTKLKPSLKSDTTTSNRPQDNDIPQTTPKSVLLPLRRGLRTRRPYGSKRRRPNTTTTTTSSSYSMNMMKTEIENNDTIATQGTLGSAELEATTFGLPLPVTSASSKRVSAFGSRRRVAIKRRRLVNRKRQKRNVKLVSFLEPFRGVYANPFFGDVVINVNVTVPALQFNYGYYGKALLKPVTSGNNPNIFEMHFLNSIWYQSGSDDMKLFSKLGMFNVQFGSPDKDGLMNMLVVFLFDTEKPPIFTRHK